MNDTRMKIRFLFFFLSYGFLYGFILHGQVDYTPADREVFDRYAARFAGKTGEPVGALAAETAMFFLQTPYVAATLEKEPERLIVDLQAFDCTTLVEVSLALARSVSQDSLTWDFFCRQLQQIRYRDGVIRNYASRNHYFSDWIVSNQRRGIVREITPEAGGKPDPVALSFMSEHPGNYKQLADTALLETIRRREREISRLPVYSVSKDALDEAAPFIRTGDILCFTTTIRGLDVTHTGFAYWENGVLTFIHASSSARKVLINPVPLADYLAGNKRSRGIRIVRPLNPVEKRLPETGQPSYPCETGSEK